MNVNCQYLPSIVLLFLFSLTCQSTGTELCPKKLKDIAGDYNAQDRFNKIRAKQNNFVLRHTHEERGTPETYDYAIKFCGESGTKQNPGSAVIQQKITNPGTKKEAKGDSHGLGTFTNSTLIGGEDWLFLMYYGGDKYNKHCDESLRETWIEIICEDQGETPTMRLVEEARYETAKSKDIPNRCYYLFEYNHPAACNHKPKKLSGGAIFLIVLVSLFGAYLFFGFLYQRFIAHAKGFEQIPNFAFWRKFGNMSADGCDFVCRREDHPSTYKGMADALDIESSDDEDKDDGLLPM